MAFAGFIGTASLTGCQNASGSGGVKEQTAVPGGLKAEAGSASATISWKDVPGAPTYNLYWSTKDGVTKANGTKIADVTSPYSLSGLTNGTTVYCVLTSVTDGVESDDSGQVSVKPAATTAADIAAPMYLTVVGTPTANSISLEWNPVVGAATYYLYSSTTAGGTYARVGTGTKETTQTVSDLAAETTLYFKVSAANAKGEGAMSASISASTAKAAAAYKTDVPGGIAGGTYYLASSPSVTLTLDPATGKCIYFVGETLTGTYTYSAAEGLKFDVSVTKTFGTVTATIRYVNTYPYAFSFSDGSMLAISASKKTEGIIGVEQGTYEGQFKTELYYTYAPGSGLQNTSTVTDYKSTVVYSEDGTGVIHSNLTADTSFTWQQDANGKVTTSTGGAWTPIWFTWNGSIFQADVENAYIKK